MRSKENRSFWERFRENSLYFFAIVTLFFGSGLIWRFCGNGNNFAPEQKEEVSPREEIVLPQVKIEQPKETQKEQGIEKVRNKNDAQTENINIKGEGFGEDMFDKDEARKLAKEMAMKDLFRKFPEDKKQIVNRYAKIIKDVTEKTNHGIWKAYIVVSVNESDIKYGI